MEMRRASKDVLERPPGRADFSLVVVSDRVRGVRGVAQLLGSGQPQF